MGHTLRLRMKTWCFVCTRACTNVVPTAPAPPATAIRAMSEEISVDVVCDLWFFLVEEDSLICGRSWSGYALIRFSMDCTTARPPYVDGDASCLPPSRIDKHLQQPTRLISPQLNRSNMCTPTADDRATSASFLPLPEGGNERFQSAKFLRPLARLTSLRQAPATTHAHRELSQ